MIHGPLSLQTVPYIRSRCRRQSGRRPTASRTLDHCVVVLAITAGRRRTGPRRLHQVDRWQEPLSKVTQVRRFLRLSDPRRPREWPSISRRGKVWSGVQEVLCIVLTCRAHLRVARNPWSFKQTRHPPRAREVSNENTVLYATVIAISCRSAQSPTNCRHPPQ